MIASEAPPAGARSLYVQLLDWMMVPLIIVWPLALLFTYVAARTIADSPYDRELAATVKALQRFVPPEPPAPFTLQPIVPPSVRDFLQTDDETDVLRIHVSLNGEELLFGDAEVPPLELSELRENEEVQFKDGEIGGARVRIAYLVVRPPGWEKLLAVQVAETLAKRERHAAEITRMVAAVLVVLLVILVMLVLYGLKRGLEPLERLREAVLARSPSNLTPLPFGEAPDEVVPLVATVNRQLERVAASVESQRRFVADAAHQMKTPLAGLKMQAELAKRASDGADLRERLGQLGAGADRAHHLVQRLLSLARADESLVAGTGAARVDLADAARNACEALAPVALERGIDFGYEPVGGPAIVAGDAVLLQELVSNLAENALKYAPRGGRVTVRVRGGDDPLLEVEDTGPGIPVADRERIFERFYRVPGSGSPGAGLGLAIVKAVAERHGATLSVEAGEGGKGSLFRASGWRQGRGP
jgi:two-component system sensor histidine kinase TctE